jgi:putative membrane protein
MTSKTLILLSGATLAITACNRSDETSTGDANNVATENVVFGNESVVAAPATAQDFVNAAAASDRFEIETSNLAATSGQAAPIKGFAAKMISAHTASTAKLKSTVAALSPPVTISDALNATQQQLLNGLKSKTGADFDAAYAAAQVAGHEATLSALNAYASTGDNATLKEFARGMIPTVTAHLNMAKGLK